MAFHAAVVYCMHLPRSYFDLVTPPARLLLRTRHLEPAHRIAFLPYPDAFVSDAPGLIYPTLILAPDDLLAEITKFAGEADAPIAAARFSSLNQESLVGHWKEIADLLSAQDLARWKGLFQPIVSPPPTLETMGPLAPMRLAVKFLARQFAWFGDEIIVGLDESDEEGLLDRFVHLHQLIEAQATVEERGELPEAEDFMEILRKHQVLPPLPLVLGSRTLRQQEAPWAQLGIRAVDPAFAEPIYEVMLSHRTLACKGFGLRLDDIPASLLQRLRQLEELCSARPH